MMDRQPGRSLLPPRPHGLTSANVSGWDKSQTPQGLRAGDLGPHLPRRKGTSMTSSRARAGVSYTGRGGPHTP